MTTHVDWPSLLEALLWVESLPASGCGLLSFGEAPSGGIFVEHNRICWAGAIGLEPRLRELLRERTTETDDFERALRRHSAESLARLCALPTATSWSARKGGYAPRCTFRPVDLLFDVVDLALPGARELASRALSPVLGRGRKGASFHMDSRDGSVVPLAAFGDDAAVESLRSLGSWAALFPAATRELGCLPSFSIARSAEGDVAFCWWHGALLHVVLCADAESAARLAAHHLGPP